MKKVIAAGLSLFLLVGSCLISGAEGKNQVSSVSTVVVDYAKKVGSATPYVFGFNNNGDIQTVKAVQDEFNKIGVTWIRKSFWFDRMLPLEVVPSIEAWNSNVSNCKNPEYWQSGHMDTLVNAKNADDMVMGSIVYTPPFLAYNGEWNGVPRNWDIFEEIIRIGVDRYKNYIDVYEIWNEYSAEYLDITGSPYTDKHTAYQDIYLHAAQAIRDVVPDAIIGGMGTAMGGSTAELESLLNNPVFTPTSNLLNFVSFHEYTDGDVTMAVENYRTLLTARGFIDMPILIDEWNASTRGDSYTNESGISFIGRTLASFMRKNIGGAFYSSGTITGGAYNEDLGICDYVASEDKVYFRPLVNAFKVPGARLGLSRGNYDLMDTLVGGTTDSIGIINSDGQHTVFMVNDTAAMLTTDVILKNISYQDEPVVKAYTASNTDNAEQGTVLACFYGDREIRTTVTLPAHSVVGIVVNDTYTPEEEPVPVVPTVPTIVNPGFEEGYDGWINNGQLAFSNAHSGALCVAVKPGHSGEQIVLGLQPNSTYRLSAYVKNFGGSQAGLGAKESGEPEVSTNYSGSEYQQIHLVFSTGANNYSAKIYIWNYTDKGIVYADDFTIETL